jgi:hypothetical protein
LNQKGVNIDVAMFDLKLQPPQNFASYRQAELDNNRISTFAQMQQIPFISNRFALERFLGLSKEEIAQNERLWREENDEFFNVPETEASAQLRDAGITGSDITADADEAAGDEITGDADIAPGADVGGDAEAEPTA